MRHSRHTKVMTQQQTTVDGGRNGSGEEETLTTMNLTWLSRPFDTSSVYIFFFVLEGNEERARSSRSSSGWWDIVLSVYLCAHLRCSGAFLGEKDGVERHGWKPTERRRWISSSIEKQVATSPQVSRRGEEEEENSCARLHQTCGISGLEE